MISTAKSFIEHDIWVLAAVSSGDKQELVELNDKLATLFKQE
jgi:hypothetical protein